MRTFIVSIQNLVARPPYQDDRGASAVEQG